MSPRPICSVALGLALALARQAPAQVQPNAHWRTLKTTHFEIHYTPQLEAQARRAAVNAEWAWSALAAQLVPPRGPVDIVLADNVDYTNGFATPFPSNRIVLYAAPPVDLQSLRPYRDWNQLIIAHELTHIFHLDRARGWWGLGQHLFGRSPLLMPNLYSPAWLTEGLAVYFESQLTDAGRLVGTEEAMLARASALDGRVPRLDELSLATPRFPGGAGVYAYGSLLIDYMARTAPAGSVKAFIERSSSQPIPFLLNSAARHSFGITFSDAWRAWRDSLTHRPVPAGAVAAGAPIPGWRTLTVEGRAAMWPRWVNDSTLVYAAADGKVSAAAFTITTGGTKRRLARRSSLEPSAVLPDGSLLFAQLEFTNPYTVRSDLYIAAPGGRERRLTHGARLTRPDARRGDGAIVAVQLQPGTTRLVRVSPDGRAIIALTGTSPDTEWSEPRWSPDGGRIAAIRWTRGGTSELVLLDTAGAVRASLWSTGAVLLAPAWSPTGTSVLVSADVSGVTDLYEVDAVPMEYAAGTDSAGAAAVVTDTGGASPQRSLPQRLPPPRVRRLSRAATGLFHPAPSPNGRLLAGTLLRADGYHIGFAPLDSITREAITDGAGSSQMVGVRRARRLSDSLPAPVIVPREAPLPPAASDTGPSHRYSPWRTLAPRYWLPVSAQTDAGVTMLGALTTGNDVVGRHAFFAQAMVPLQGTAEPDLQASYRYSGFGLPLVDLAASQYFEHGGVFDTALTRVGAISRRTRDVAAVLTLIRLRARTFGWLAGGGQLEFREYRTDPATLIDSLNAFYRAGHTYPSLVFAGGWSNTQRPDLSISPEDGLSTTFTLRQRWLSGGAGTRTRSAVAAGRAYRSIPPLPGLGARFAHSVLAIRGSAGWADVRATSLFGAGGVSGLQYELLPGYQIGDPQRSFPVRGFTPGTQAGIRAAAGSVEYRAPVGILARGIRLLPVFFDRMSLLAFADAGSAWCPVGTPAGLCTNTDTRPRWLASAGAELHLDAALHYDAAYRFRVGVAAPVSDRTGTGASAASVYFTLGLSF